MLPSLPMVRWISYLEAQQYEVASMLREPSVREREAIQQSIRDLQIWVDGASHLSTRQRYVPLLDERQAWVFSFRRWGELMAGAWSVVHGQQYDYVDFCFGVPLQLGPARSRS